MKISIGPIPTNFGEEKLIHFYQEVASLPQVGRVYVGEIGCSKREVLDRKLFSRIRDFLERGGKEVIFSTQVLATTKEDFKRNNRLMKLADGVEVNSLGFLNFIQRQYYQMPLTIGPTLNIYNPIDAEILASWGASQVVLGFDLNFESLKKVAKSLKVPLELPVYGHFPLAYSWCCFTAKAFGRERKTCGFACYKVKEMLLENLERKTLFLVNGTVIYSGKVFSLLSHLPEIEALGIKYLRVYPLIEKVREIVETIDGAISKKIPLSKAKKILFSLSNKKLKSQPMVRKYD